MQRVLFALAVSLSLALGWGRPAPTAPPPRLDDLTAELDRVIPDRMQRTRTPGAAIAVVQRGELVWSRGYGQADLAAKRPLTDDSLFGVASISKTAAAWGVMALVEAGRIDLDAPVEQYLTRWKFPPSAYDSRGVTVRRLLSHSAGLNTPEYLGYPAGRALPAIETVLTHGDGRTPGVRIVDPPGKKFAYSDGGYLLLQLLVEEVGGMSFDRYMQSVILDPLGLPQATFTLSPEVAARRVTSYDPYGRPFPHYDFVELAPAGLYISAPDLARFVASGMHTPGGAPAGRGVLSPAAVERMLQPQVDIRFPENQIYARGYGLGVFIDPFPAPGSLVSHMGGNLNGVTEFVARPATGDAIIVLTTGIAGHEVFADAVSIWTAWLGSPPATLPRAIRVSRHILFSVANFLTWSGLMLCVALLWRLRQGRRSITLRRDARPVWLRLLLAAIPLVSLWLYFTHLDPLLRVSMPSIAGSMGVGVSGVVLAALVWGLSARAAHQ